MGPESCQRQDCCPYRSLAARRASLSNRRRYSASAATPAASCFTAAGRCSRSCVARYTTPALRGRSALRSDTRPAPRPTTDHQPFLPPVRSIAEQASTASPVKKQAIGKNLTERTDHAVASRLPSTPVRRWCSGFEPRPRSSCRAAATPRQSQLIMSSWSWSGHVPSGGVTPFAGGSGVCIMPS